MWASSSQDKPTPPGTEPGLVSSRWMPGRRGRPEDVDAGQRGLLRDADSATREAGRTAPAPNLALARSIA